MKKTFFKFILVSTTVFNVCLFGQNETNTWYFGTQAGLSFSTNPPTALTDGALSTIEGCSSISVANGNILFYTDAITVYDKTHSVMANGTGLFGDITPAQSSIIAKKPGSQTLYYIFTVQGYTGTAGVNYSIVDMSLAAGLGSVTVKNSPLFVGRCAEKITGTKHCNGTDIWILTHDYGNKNFRANLLSSAGLNSLAAVISTIGSNCDNNWQLGCMKLSPDGKRLASASFNSLIELFDFDNSTGVVSNSLILNSSGFSAYGCEFSADGTKLYGGEFGVSGRIKQYDLCAGSNSAIISSSVLLPATGTEVWSMQLAKNGKIYCASNSNSLGVINNPNSAGIACGYSINALSIAPKTTTRSLPNFIGSFLRQGPPPFTYTTTCQNTSFAATPLCGSTNYNIVWSFGDASSGASNSSTLSNPFHAFSSLGNYTVKCIYNYPCFSDTLKQVITVSGVPSINILGSQTICIGGTSIYTATGASSYTWSNGSNASTISVSPSVSTTYSVVGSNSAGCIGNTIFTVTSKECTSIKDLEYNFKFTMYPNPVDNDLNFESEEPLFISIYNCNGELIFESKFEKGLNKINTSDFPSALYFMLIKNSENCYSKKFIKE